MEISVSTESELGTVENVRIFVDGEFINLQPTFPPADPLLGTYSRDGVYAFEWSPTRPGTYEVIVQAMDDAGRVSKIESASRATVVIGSEALGMPPVLRMTEPLPGGFGDNFPDYSYNSELFINLEAYDPDGDLEYVQPLFKRGITRKC